MKDLFAHITGVLFLCLIRAKLVYPAKEVIIASAIGFATALSIAALSTAVAWIIFNPSQRTLHTKHAFIISLWVISIALVSIPLISQ